MRRAILFASLFVPLVVASSLLYAILPVAGATYTPGVSAGNYVKFGAPSETYTSTDPNQQTKPQSIKDIDNTASYRADVQSVSGNNVTIKETQSFNNGTSDKIMILIGNVNTGTGNASGSGFVLIIAGGLGQNDKLCTGTSFVCSATLNQTQTRTYAGASRTVGVLSMSHSFSGNSQSISLYWDQSSGVLLELSTSFTLTSGSSQQYSTTETEHITASETNIWSATILGLSPLLFYGIIGAIAVIIVIIAGVMVMRMRKPKAPGMPASTTGTTPPASGP